jgi:TolB-like protein
MTGTKVGHYEVGEKLGAGGMGEVYRARDTRLLRQVALKFLPPALGTDPIARARFLREAQAASALEHPNIQAIYEIGEHEDRLYIAMALYEGETLLERMRRGALPVADCEAIIRQLLEAIGAAHEAGIVHRDLKPANVILSRSRTSLSGQGKAIHVKVVDFGLAKLHSDGPDSRTHLTEQGALMGTVAYMSPEQARGEEIDGRTDIWAAGVLAYEMLAGKHPFEAPSHVGTLTRIATEDPKPLEELREDVPPRLRRLVVEMLRKDREQRVPDAAAALAMLEVPDRESAQALQAESFSHAAPTAIHPSVPSVEAPSIAAPKVRRWPLALGVGAAVALVAVAAFLVTRFGGSGTIGGGAGVVVLPCRVLVGDGVDFLTDAVPATLSTLLGQVPGLDTRRPPTSQEMNPASIDLAKVARTYGVDSCFTCDVLVQGQTLQLNVQLVDARSGQQPWTGSYQGSTDTYLDVIQRAAREIRDYLVPGTPGAVPADAVAANSEAELEFRRGQYHSERYNDAREPLDLELALAAFQRSLQLDENLGAAAGEIALLKLWQLGGEGAEEVTVWIDKALELDPTSHRAWTTKAFLAWDAQEHTEAFESALQAIRYGADDPLAHWAVYGLLKIFSNDLSLPVVERATVRNRLYAWGYVGQASALFQQGRLDEALDRLEKTLEHHPDHYAGNAYKSIFAATAGKTELAREALARIENARNPTPTYLREYARFAVEFVASSGSERQALLERFDRERCRDFQCLDEAYRFLTPLLFRNGERERGVELLEQYAAGGSMPAYDWLMLNPDTLALLNDPRIEPIREGSRTQYDEWRERLAALRERGELPDFLEDPLDDLERKLEAL